MNNIQKIAAFQKRLSNPFLANLLVIIIFVAISYTGHCPAEPSAKVDELSRAWTEYSFQNWDLAQKLFTKSLKKSQNNPKKHSDALFGLAMINHHRTTGSDLKKAKAYYEKICSQYPNSELTPWSKLALARIAEKEEPAKASILYKQIVDEYPEKLVANESILRICLLTAQFEDPKATKKACSDLEEVLKARPDMPFAVAAHLLLGDIYLFPLKNYEKSIEHFMAADKIGVGDPRREPEMYYQIAKIARTELDQPEIAIQYLEKLIEKFPRNINIYRARLELAELKNEQ